MHDGACTEYPIFVSFARRTVTVILNLLQAVRCQGSAGPNWPGSGKYMLCSMCSGQMGKLSPMHPARDSCTICGQWVPSPQQASLPAGFALYVVTADETFHFPVPNKWVLSALTFPVT